MSPLAAAALNARWRFEALSPTLCLGCIALPLAVVLIELASVRLLTPEQHFRWIASEFGVTENATVIVALVATGLGLAIFRSRGGFPVAAWGWGGLLAAAGALYFAGEEASWGQHLLGWSTPETFVDLNNQNETNLHNVHPLFGRIPKALVELGMVVLGLVYPLTQLRRPPPPRASWRHWLLPTVTVVPTCLLAVACRGLNRFERWADVDLAIRWGEIQEYHIACFMLLYLLTIWRRLHAG